MKAHLLQRYSISVLSVTMQDVVNVDSNMLSSLEKAFHGLLEDGRCLSDPKFFESSSRGICS